MIRAKKVPMEPAMGNRTSARVAVGGFTLMEVMVVVVLAGVLTLLAMPRFQSFLSPDVTREVQMDLENLLMAVRQEAVLSRTPLAVVYNLQEGVFRSAILLPDGTLGMEGDPVSLKGRLPPGVRFMEISTMRGNRVGQGECFTIVWPSGWIEPTVIHIQDEKNRPYTAMIEPLSGAVRMDEGFLVRKKTTL
jgi:prepilin-type N-terminal cleavage/methylation domain-containing protein